MDGGCREGGGTILRMGTFDESSGSRMFHHSNKTMPATTRPSRNKAADCHNDDDEEEFASFNNG